MTWVQIVVGVFGLVVVVLLAVLLRAWLRRRGAVRIDAQPAAESDNDRPPYVPPGRPPRGQAIPPTGSR